MVVIDAYTVCRTRVDAAGTADFGLALAWTGRELANAVLSKIVE